MRLSERRASREAYQLLLRWLARALPSDSLEDFVAVANDSVLADEVKNLTALLFSGKPATLVGTAPPQRVEAPSLR